MADSNSCNVISTDVIIPTMDKYKVYKRRWYMLSVIAVINFSNAVIWITFSPVADVTTQYFDITTSQVNWLSLVFLIATIPFGVGATWLLDTVGLRASITLSAWLNCIGSILRVVSCLNIPANCRFPILITGQSLAACAQPFILISPTKMAALWFKDNQRATANMLASMANPLGIMVANLISPALVKQESQIPLLLYMYTIPAILGAIMSIFICRSVPPTPPTSSAEKPSEPFTVGLKQLVKNKSYLVLCLNFGAGLGLFTALSTLFQQILCPRGYTDYFSGICGAVFIGSGIIGAGLAGLLIDYTKRFELIIKTCACITTLFSIMFSLVSRYEDQNALIVASISLFGLFGFSLYPSCMEAAVECTYPVAEATSSGLLMIAGQFLGVIFIVVMQLLAKPMSPWQALNSTCNTNSLSNQSLDFTISNLFGSGMLVLFSVLSLVFCFSPKLKRLTAEKKAAAQDIISAIRRHTDDDTVPVIDYEIEA